MLLIDLEAGIQRSMLLCSIGKLTPEVYKNGFKNRLDLEKAKIEKLAKIDKIGLTIANNIKAELTKIRY